MDGPVGADGGPRTAAGAPGCPHRANEVGDREAEAGSGSAPPPILPASALPAASRAEPGPRLDATLFGPPGALVTSPFVPTRGAGGGGTPHAERRVRGNLPATPLERPFTGLSEG